jgi:hypothetical protein
MDPSHLNDDSHRVLHTLRCIGSAGDDRLSLASGLSQVVASECLHQLSNDGLAVLDPGPFGGWSITDAGRLADDQWLGEELDTSGARGKVRDGYQQFLLLNPGLLEICSDWQMRTIGGSPALNDHTDPDYDAAVLSRLFRVDESVQGLLVDLAEAVTRFSVYTGRMEQALRHAMAGDHGYVADRLDSYHTVWFQLHEDLLTTLGMSREEERGNSLQG